MGQEKNAENIPFLRSTQPKSTERVPVVELSGSYNRTFKVRYNGNRTCFKRFMKCDEEKTATILVIWKVSEKV